MSSNIDERIVDMKFNNSEFEAGIKSTLASLESLKKGLNLSGATKGLDDVAAAGKRFSLGNISTGLDNLATKFNSMSVVGIAALATLASKAAQYGLQIAKGFFAPIKDGLSEYETNINSIQTILANTSKEGTTLKQVNSALSELNEYSDKTIYNFAQMARNIGTFTAAGVKLDTSVAAIKGIANLAAVSGSNAEQASTAMYQLSQALATGKVQLMDWNSVVNAGMGGKVFQDALYETGKRMDKIISIGSGKNKVAFTIDEWVKSGHSFRDSLQSGWLTSEVLTETLSKFTGDMTEQQLLALGYSKEQVASIQALGKTAQEAATKVKTMSQLFGTLKEAGGSGWAQTWQLIFGDFEEARTLFTSASDVLGGFIKASADARNAVLGDWKKLGGRTELIKAISNAFQALLSVLKPIKEAFQQVFPPTTGQQLFAMTVALRKFTETLKMGDSTAGKVKRTFVGIFAALDIGRMFVVELVKAIGKLFGAFSNGSGGILDTTSSLGDWLLALRNSIKAGDKFAKFFEGLGTILRNAGNYLKDFSQAVRDLDFKNLSLEAFAKVLKTLAPLGPVGRAIGGAFGKALDILTSFWDKLVEIGTGIGQIGSKIGNSLKRAFNFLFNDVNLGDTLDVIDTGILATIALLVKKLVDVVTGASDKLSLLDHIKDTLSGVTDTLSAMQNTLRAVTLLAIATALGILTLSIIALSKIDSAGLTRALTAITVMFAQLFGSMLIFEKMAGGKGFAKMPLVTAGMVLLAIAIRILASAVAKFSELSWEELAKGLISVGALLGALTLFTKFAETNAGGIAQGAGIILLATGIRILASAVAAFSNISWEGIAKGLVAISAILLAFGLFSQTVGNPLAVLAAGASLVAISVAMNILALAVRQFGSMPWKQLGKGLLSMGLALVIVVAALNALPPTTLASAAALLVVANALVILSAALRVMGAMDGPAIAKSLIVLAGSLAIIAAAMILMTSALPGAAALLIVSAALAVLTPVLIAFGAMKWSEIAKALITLAAAFVIIGVAGALLTPVVPTLIAFGVAVALVGAGLMLAGAGILLFATGLTALAVSGAAGAAAITTIVMSIINLIPPLFKAIGEAIIALAEALAKGGDAIFRATVTVLEAMVKAIDQLSPKIIITFMNLIVTLLEELAKNIPRMASAGAKILIGFLKGIRDNISEVVGLGLQIVAKFLEGIGKNIGKVAQAGADLVIAFINTTAETIRKNSGPLGKAGGNLASAIIEGMVNGFTAGAWEVGRSARRLGEDAINSIKGVLGIASPSKEFFAVGEFGGEGLVGGLNSYQSAVGASGRALGKEAILGLRKTITGLSDLLDTSMTLNPTITPVIDLTSVEKAATKIDEVLGARPMLVDATVDSANAAANGYDDNQQAANDANVDNSSTVSFTQNITSPKAVSDVEVYRQTKSLLSTLEGK